MLTADDGSYVLESLPEGALQVAFFHTGYDVDSLDIELSAGEERALPVLRLTRSVDGPASVKGKLTKADDSPATDARVRLRHAGTELMIAVTEPGEFSRGALTSGVYSLSLERTGSLSITLYNVLLSPGETDLGTLTLLDGPSVTVALEGADPKQSPPVVLGSDAGVGSVIDAGQSNDAGLVSPGDAGAIDDAGTTQSDAGSPPAMVDSGSPFDAGIDFRPVGLATGPEVAAAGSQPALRPTVWKMQN